MPTLALLDIGDPPPLGVTPESMHAFVIRKERHGSPRVSFQREVVPVWQPGPREVLVYVMAAGVNYNGVWAGLGKPLSVLDAHRHPFHVAGSDAAGVVWAVGPGVTRWKVGDEVVVHCNRTCGDCEYCNGGDPMLCRQQAIWGYETPDGAFAQFTRAQTQQLLPKPPHLSWEEASCYTLVLCTAYRMLHGFPPHDVKPGMNVLVWGGAGGLGSMAVQLVKNAGANAIAVVSSPAKAEFVKRLGAAAVINRGEFECFGRLPETKDPEAYGAWLNAARKFGKAIWDFTGKGNDVDIVFEHPGEQTFPLSCFIVKRGGMVVFCGATTGFNLTFDAAYVWMRQKRIQGSHFATFAQCAAANRLVAQKKIDPALSRVFPFDECPEAHELMHANRHPEGNMCVLVNAPRPGLRTLAECR
ncbi:MAG: crotonyl-CoA carboxylase/reductase [Planctomycetes bacterium]|nr:crotonyl-CoA carboxylase/reductase [Planctomycetota bacterium]